jgi:hypothetical protein
MEKSLRHICRLEKLSKKKSLLELRLLDIMEISFKITIPYFNIEIIYYTQEIIEKKISARGRFLKFI